MTNERLTPDQLFAQADELGLELDAIERTIEAIASYWIDAYARHDREAIDETSAQLDFELANARRVSNKIARKISLAVKRDAEDDLLEDIACTCGAEGLPRDQHKGDCPAYGEQSIGTLGRWRDHA